MCKSIEKEGEGKKKEESRLIILTSRSIKSNGCWDWKEKGKTFHYWKYWVAARWLHFR